MIEITKEKDEIKIVISYKKLIKSLSSLLLIFSYFNIYSFWFWISSNEFNPLRYVFIYLILISFLQFAYEKITIKEKLYITRSDKNNKRICYSQKIISRWN